MREEEIIREKNRILEVLKDADLVKIKAMNGLLDAMSYETVYLDYLRKKIFNLKKGSISGEKINNAIVKHSATLTNITDKVMKWLASENIDDDYSMSEYE